ncbi:Ger(x)C family spore germination protein [Streptomyces sp900116325]|uniref:Ger(x)C family spore germination protein n=1 Tax=Streptomyces sp. 900116325 TaxID=3154295 RepID=UPI0033297B5A
MKVFKLMIIICLIITLTGCWDRSEITEVSIVTGMAVDKGENQKYKLTIETTTATEMNRKTAQGYAPSYIQSLEGNTIGELTHKVSISSATRYIYSHMRLLIISEEIAEEGLISFMDFLYHNREIRNDFNIVIAKGGDAADLIKIVSTDKKSSALKIYSQLMTMHEEWGGAPNIKLKDFVHVFTSDGQVPVLAAMRLIGDSKKGGNVKNMKQVSSDNKVTIDSLGILKNGKLIAFLSLEEIRGMLFLQNKIKNTVITANCGKENKKYGLRITRSNTKVSAKEEDGVPSFRIKVRAEGYVQGTECITNLENPDTYKNFEKSINKKMKQDLTDLVFKMKEDYRADIFGFGEHLKDQNYKVFKKYKNDWENHFVDSKIHIDFYSDVKRSGIRKERYIIK